MKKFIKDLGIDENFTKPRPLKKQTEFNHVKNNIPLVKILI